MRKVILSMQLTLDGFIEGPNGEMDWLIYDDDGQWKDLFEMLRSVDTFLLGRAMYPGYADYWRATLANPSAPKNEMEYARLAEKTSHIVFSRTLEKADWKNTRIARGNIQEEISNLKQQPGKDMVVWGGASFASSLINQGLVDEYRLLVNPVLLGKGKSLFKDVSEKHQLNLVETKTFKSGIVVLRYRA